MSTRKMGSGKMKITIDTEEKTISLSTETKLTDLIDFLKEHFPKEWAQYKICNETIIVTLPYPEYEQDWITTLYYNEN
jgi:hypothetical protein